MKVTIVTCTGGRPQLFDLCKRWVRGQSRKPSQWIVTDDVGDVALDHDFLLLRPKPTPEHLLHLPYANARWALISALKHVEPGNHVVVMEDDDYYHHDHVAIACDQLREHRIVQLQELMRFHLPTARMSKGLIADESALLVPGISSFRYEAIGDVIAALQTEPFGRLPIHHYSDNTVASIKGVGHGLPGRAGATTKHRADHPKVRYSKRDVDHREFRQLLGEEHARMYLSLLE